jgi:hypothetical protein
MHAQDRADLATRVSHGTLVVGQARTVRRPDLDEAGTRLRDHLGDPEAAADLDQLPARDDDRGAVARQRRGGQQHGAGAVVDGDRRVGAGQISQQAFDMSVPAAAFSGN